MNKFLISFVILCLILLFSGCNKLINQLDDYIQKAQKNWAFNGAVLVSYQGKPILTKGYGKSQISFDELNSTTTKFFIGSITKQFTAVAILILAQENKLELDDPISKYITNYPQEIADQVTIHHLLSHTSGLSNYTDNIELLLQRTEAITTKDIIESFKNLPLIFEPGADFHYSNSGYVLLGQIIEKVSGQSYEAFLHKHIFKPLGMNSSGYARRVMGHPDRAEGYTINDSGLVTDALQIEFSFLHSAGALYSTIEDLLKWENALRTSQLLPEYLTLQLFTPHAPNYGYGFWLDSQFDKRRAFHGGYIDGFNSTFEMWLDDNISIGVFSNEDKAPVKKIALGLAAIIFGYKPVIPVQKQIKEIELSYFLDYEGVYKIDTNLYQYVVLENDFLFTYIIGDHRQRIFPEKIDLCFFEIDNTETVKFLRNDQKEVFAIEINNGFNKTIGYKLPWDIAYGLMPFYREVMVPIDKLEEYSGEYAMEGSFGKKITFSLTVNICNNRLCASIGGAVPVVLRQIKKDYFVNHSSGLTVKFKRSFEGIDKCQVNLGTANVIGTKIKP